MNHRFTTIAVVTGGLMVLMGFGAGCQVPRLRVPESRWLPWRQHEERKPFTLEEQPESEYYVPQSQDEVPRLSLPPEPDVTPPSKPVLKPVPAEKPQPVPPATENESSQVRRWLPTRRGFGTSSIPQTSRETVSHFDQDQLPPARVTYDEQEPMDEPVISPNSAASVSSQPRLFRPAESAKNMFDSMRRKLSRNESQ